VRAVKRGAFAALVAALMAAAPVATGETAVMADGPERPTDVYVCIDASPEDPGVYLSSTDCASGTPDTATFSFYDARTGMEIVVHLKSCLTQTCVHRPCMVNPCEPECVSRFVCAYTRCVAELCGRCPPGVACADPVR
jgi:hypothetical protein